MGCAGVILPTEREVQRSILDMAGTSFPAVFIHHSPNGAHLAGNDVARFKQMGALLGDGMKKGFPDLICVWAPAKVAFMEVKRPKLGKTSEDQEKIQAKLESLECHVATVTSQEEAYHFLVECGAPCAVKMRWEPI